MSSAVSARLPLTILGGGCMGLSIGVQLQSLGFTDITIIARDITPNTTSDGAGALWRPFGDSSIAASAGLYDRWGHSTFYFYLSLLRAFGSVSTGILTVPGIEAYDEPQPEPYWARTVLNYHELSEAERAAHGLSAYRYVVGYTSLLVDMKVYLAFLQREFLAKGGKIIQGEINSLNSSKWSNQIIDQRLANSAMLFNCLGLGAGPLLTDSSLYPVRGQLVYVNLPHLFHFYMYANTSNGEYTYIFPRVRDVVVGGTYDKHDSRPLTHSQRDEETKRDILNRAAKFVPELQSAECFPLREWSGLRPARDFVRLELESGGLREVISPPANTESREKTLKLQSNCSLPIVHNYGHGGSGMTLHWGCATDSLRLARATISAAPQQVEQLDFAQISVDRIKALFPHTTRALAAAPLQSRL